MKIKIETEKSLDRGKKVFTLKNVELLPEKELPTKYTEGMPAVYLEIVSSYSVPVRTITTISNLHKKGQDNDLYKQIESFWEGRTYTPEDMEYLLERCREGASRLHEINSQLAVENAGWEGIETLII